MSSSDSNVEILEVGDNEAMNLVKVNRSIDANEDSIMEVALQLMSSHLYSVAGAMRFLGCSFLVWTDFSRDLIKEDSRTKKAQTYRVNELGMLEEKTYHYLMQGETKFGLSPAFQKFVFESDENISRFGLQMKEEFTMWAGETVKYLVFDHSKIYTEPIKSTLAKLWK